MKGLLIMSALNDFKELKQQVSFLGRSDSKRFGLMPKNGNRKL